MPPTTWFKQLRTFIWAEPQNLVHVNFSYDYSELRLLILRPPCSYRKIKCSAFRKSAIFNKINYLVRTNDQLVRKLTDIHLSNLTGTIQIYEIVHSLNQSRPYKLLSRQYICLNVYASNVGPTKWKSKLQESQFTNFIYCCSVLRGA